MSDPGVALKELEDRPLTDLHGVGKQTSASLSKVGINTILDLISYYPRRYIDRSKEATVDSLQTNEEGMVLVNIEKVRSRRMRSRKTLVEVTASDVTGSLKLVFFNQPWREKQLNQGRDAVVFGKVDIYQGQLQMTNPIVDLVGDRTGRIVAVYPQSEIAKLHSWDVDRLVAEALRRVMKVRGFADPVPSDILKKYRLVDRSAAYKGIHRPDSMSEVAEARRRLVFDELFRIQLELLQRKKIIEKTSIGINHSKKENLTEVFLKNLSFELTDSQKRVMNEIRKDLEKEIPMHRLLQGDVGSGKTIVAVFTLLKAVQGGHQGALMAPTEVLAEQHYLGISKFLDNLIVEDSTTLLGDRPLQVDLLTNRTSSVDRKRINRGLEDGTVDFIIGTHSLIQESVSFNSLGAVVIDEQHRFGVEQRASLKEKNRDGRVPDVLVMTATPIPRTAAMTVYGDLDVSVLDELPPGRIPIVTSWEADNATVWETVKEEIKNGRQAYVVCPLIEDSEKLEVHSAEKVHKDLSDGPLKDFQVGLLHGRLDKENKEETMSSFRSGKIDVLVATTVIEVGVDVPNASIVVILDAARFGVAQLHQLRGRVGRGEHPSQCLLVGETTTKEAEERIKAMVRTTDGFELAEVDLELRGEGTVMGERQKGRNDLRLASLRRDKEWVEIARMEASEILIERDLASIKELAKEVTLFLGESEADYLLKS
ncbi:MAG: ATP-dependent DNA helicase RecG [Acidimicrobiales bacterium]|nr:ATP-dependent DNA helicase RecG [Acidimicrobiales bacterium]